MPCLLYVLYLFVAACEFLKSEESMNTATFIAICQQPDGQRVTRIVRLIGDGDADAVAAMLKKNGLIPREIIRAPTGASLDTIAATCNGSYQIMYMQGK